MLSLNYLHDDFMLTLLSLQAEPPWKGGVFLWAFTASFIQKISGDNICNMFTDRTRGSVQITLL